MIGMKPHDIREDKATFPMLLEAKYDGMRGLYRDGEFWSLEGNRIPGMILYKNWIKQWTTNPVELDGELVVPDTDFETGCGIIRSKRLKTNAHFKVFDLPSSGKVRLIERKRWLQRYMPAVYHLSESKIEYVPYHIVNSMAEVDFWYGVYLKNGLEGVVVKDPNSFYVRKRSWDWMRKKPDNLVDATITGFVGGTGKYNGTLGALVVQDTDGRSFRVGGGLTDAQRFNVWENRASYRGMSVEIIYQRRTNTGSYRHPRVKRFRLDRVG